MDAFAVSIAAGFLLSPVGPRQMFRLAFHFGLFQFLMPVIGWLAGQTVAGSFSVYDHWIAFGLLWYVGGKMFWESFHREESEPRGDPTRGLTLVTLSVATSLDALAVGLSMALLRCSIWGPSVVIGIVAAAFTTVGITFGGRLGPRLGRWAELAGGIILMTIGAKIVGEHLLG
jgi:putative Mn2+ efflux pump MntP